MFCVCVCVTLVFFMDTALRLGRLGTACANEYKSQWWCLSADALMKLTDYLCMCCFYEC